MKPLLFILLCLIACACNNGAPGHVVELDQKQEHLVVSKDFDCVLTVASHEIKSGELPEFSVRIVNNSPDTALLIGSLDGSDVGWRIPHCYFTIERPLFSLAPSTYGRCGNMNPLRKQDFVRIGPTESFDPYRKGFFGSYQIQNEEQFTSSGQYTVQFHYSTNSTGLNDFPIGLYDVDSLELSNLITRLSKVELHSNIVELNVN